MQKSPAFPATDLAGIKNWFAQYLTWLTTSKNGLDEHNATNNHGTCWVLQVAGFARLTGNEPLLAACRERYQTVLLPAQMAPAGSFPQELKRTKPYGRSPIDMSSRRTTHQLSSCSQPVHSYC